MNLSLRAMMPAILLMTAIGLSACDRGTESTNAGKPPANDQAPTLAPAKAAGFVTVSEPWIRPTAPGQTVSGAFMTLVNTSGTASALTSVSFDGASAVEIHETSMDGGVMRMRKVSHIDIPANGSAVLKPGSYHVMLMGLERGMKAGTTETLTLTFSDGSEIPVEAQVGALSD